MSRFLFLLGILASSSCESLSPHDNFKDHMSSTIGKKISDPHTWAREDRHVSVKQLANGNVEHKYMFRRSCWYFFEVEKGTDVIIGWRYEGDARDCAIAP